MTAAFLHLDARSGVAPYLRWLTRGRRAGLDDDSIEALYWDTFRAVACGQSRQD